MVNRFIGKGSILQNRRRSKTINTLVDARSVGLKNISVSVENIENERNTVNNRRQLAIEVIDEKTNVAIISEIMHPDLGAIKKSIESNEQRSVSILKPTVNPNTLEEIDLFVLYQPTASFQTDLSIFKTEKRKYFHDYGSADRLELFEYDSEQFYL